MWLNVIREFEKSFRRKPCCLVIFIFFMVTVEVIERVHMEEEQTPLLWLCASCSNLFFMVLNFLPFVS